MTVACCSYRSVRIADRVVQIQMDMAKGESDLQRQRRQRQQRTAPPMAMNPVHLIPTIYPNIMLPLP